MRNPRSRGFTLSELAVVTAVLGTALAIGVPAFGRLRDDLAIRSTSNELGTVFARARLESVVRRQVVAVCPGQPATGCRGDGRWDGGWLLYVATRDRDGPQQPEHVLHEGRPHPRVTVAGNRSGGSVRFLPDGRASGSNLTITLCAERSTAAGRRLVLSNAGRLRTETLLAGDPACGP